MKHLYLILFIFLIISSSLFAQVVYEPFSSDIYSFLDRLAQKGVIQFHDEIKPVSREYIAEKLIELSYIQFLPGNKLTALEKEELAFYLKEYAVEIKNKNSLVKFFLYKSMNNVNNNMTFLGDDPYGRFRVFSYEDSLFKININPILGYSLGSWGVSKYSHEWTGISLYGYIGSNIGFSFRYNDNYESINKFDTTKSFTPQTGITKSKQSKNNVEYSDMNGSLNFNWSWLNLSVGKDYFEWGYGESGNVVLSNKAPSFPYFRLDIHPVKWLRFNYIFGILNSDIIDSSTIYSTPFGLNRSLYRAKYYASHTITVTPHKGTDISLGESIIFSDRFEPIYLVPVLFFKLADDYVSNAQMSNGSNSQFFLGLSNRDLIKNTHLYGSLFIDEITLEGLFNQAKQRNQLGFMLGTSVTDLPIDNLTATVEYTKIYPFVYSNWLPTQTYTNSGYLMGDWIGSNADMIYCSLNYGFLRGLQATLWTQYISKGSSGTVQQEYETPQPPFLFGNRLNYFYFGADLKYEITYDLFANLHYERWTEKFLSNNLTQKANQFYLSLSYGLE